MEYLAWRGKKVTGAELRALVELAACRTPALGGHASRCDTCGAWEHFYHSCRNRHCPLCGGAARARWLDRCREDLLPVRYYHTIFTLPHELCALAVSNPKLIYSLLLRSAAETLQEVAADPKHLGAKIGAMLVLHTWGQKLPLHPHVHGVVPGGGLSPDGTRWIKPRGEEFFLPVQVLSRVFRGKFLAGLKQAWRDGKLRLEGELAFLAEEQAWNKWMSPLYRKEWNVFVEAPPEATAGNPEAMLKYLARYAWGVAISNSRLDSLADGKVTFRWKDYRDENREKSMTLPALEFLRRFLQHLLPPGFVRIRYYGFLSMRQREKALPLCRTLLKLAGAASCEPCELPPLPPSADAGEVPSLRTCRVCGQGKLRPVKTWRRRTLPELMRHPVWFGAPPAAACGMASSRRSPPS